MTIDEILFDIELDSFLSEIEKEYYRLEIPKVRKAINEFKSEIGQWGQERRLTLFKNTL